jgi:hypothetical protein
MMYVLYILNVCVVLKIFRQCEFYYITCKYYTMFILIFVDLKQINVTYSYYSNLFKVWFLHFKY